MQSLHRVQSVLVRAGRVHSDHRHQLRACADCEEGTYIGTECLETDSPTAAGRDTQCSDCSSLKDSDSGYFIDQDCNPLLYFDYGYDTCTTCVYGEYQTKDCIFGDKDTLGEDRECANCQPIPDCAENNFCETDSDQKCSRCGQPGADVIDGRDEAYFTTWETCCARRSLGSQCEWIFHDSGCDEGQKNFMERSAKRGGFFAAKKSTAAEFVLWCKLLCDETQQCNAFEVPTAIANGEEEPVDGTLCGLKDHQNYDFGSGGAAHTCWSKRPMIA